MLIFVYVPFYVFQVTKMIVDAIREIHSCCFSSQAIKAVGKASSYRNFLNISNLVTILCEKKNTF